MSRRRLQATEDHMISHHSNDSGSPERLPAPKLAGRRRRSLAIIGIGAFGEFCIQHLRPFFDLRLCDNDRNLEEICWRHGVQSVDLRTAARQDIVLLAVPFGQLRSTAKAIAPHLRPGSLVVDVCSIKSKPLAILTAELPACVDIVGTHPLFGPQSGRSGISGLRIAVCPARGRRGRALERFLRDGLKLDVISTTAEQHDRQMAYVQGMTHLIARIMVAMDMPRLDHTTTTFSHLEKMIDMVRQDSDELFRTIIADNPFAAEVVGSFVRATKDVLQPLTYPANGNVLR
jgi:prephenate dehydrogenase